MKPTVATRRPRRQGRFPRSPRSRFICLRHILPTRTLARVQFIYGVLAEARLITLQAIPRTAGQTLVISNRARARLLRAFLYWMSRCQPDWTSGPDCGGVLTWDLSTDQFAHRHAGYTQQFFARTHSGAGFHTSSGESSS